MAYTETAYTPSPGVTPSTFKYPNGHMPDERVKGYERKFAELKLRRTPFEPYWNDLREMVRSTAQRFGSQSNITPDPAPSPYSFDSTATWALDQLASGLHSSLTSPNERWFHLGVDSDRGEQLAMPVRAWIEEVSDILYQAFQHPRSTFHSSLHEDYLDIGCFGTGVLYIDYDPAFGSTCYKAFPLHDCWADESSNFQVDTLYRKTTYTKRQLVQAFPGINEASEKVFKSGDDRLFEVIHIAHPRSDRSPEPGPMNKRYASVWVCFELGFILKESGYDFFPYMVPRWTKYAGELYGRGPGMNSLPDIRMLNAMWKTILRAAQKMADPPLMLPDDGFMLPLRTTPGGLNYYRTGMAERIEALPVPSRLDVPVDILRDRQEAILKAFYVDWLLMDRKKERQTAFEIHDARQEKMVLMAPMVGRLKSELLGPIITSTYSLLAAWGHIPDAPEELMDNRPLRINYVSPAFKAQQSSKSQSIERYLQQLLPLTQVDPTVLDALDMDRLVQEYALLGDVSPRVLRSKPEIDAIREQRAAQEQQAAQIAQAEQASSAMKNVAQARAADPAASEAASSFLLG